MKKKGTAYMNVRKWRGIVLQVLTIVIIFLISFLVSTSYTVRGEEALDQGPEIEAAQYSQTEDMKIIADNIKQCASHWGKDSEVISDGIEGLQNQDGTSLLKKVKNILSLSNLSKAAHNCIKLLFKELYANKNIFGKLIIMVLLCAILKNLQVSFLSENVSKLAFYVCYIAVVSNLIVSFNTVIRLSADVLDMIASFSYSSIPVLIALLISSGNVSTAVMFKPIIISVIPVCVAILKNVFIPLTFLYTILSVVNNISNTSKLIKLAAFIKLCTVVCTGIMLTVFIALVSMNSFIGVSIDGVASKTARFAIGTFVPVIGRYLSDAADSVIGCTILIKNMSGVIAMIGIIGICIVPILKITSVFILYKITCAVIEPISDKAIVECINGVSGSIALLLGIISSSILMLLILITSIIVASSGFTLK